MENPAKLIQRLTKLEQRQQLQSHPLARGELKQLDVNLYFKDIKCDMNALCWLECSTGTYRDTVMVR